MVWDFYSGESCVYVGAGVYGKSLYLMLNFAVNGKLP